MATSGRAPPRSRTTCRRTGSRTMRAGAARTTSVRTRSRGRHRASCSTAHSARGSRTPTTARSSPGRSRRTCSRSSASPTRTPGRPRRRSRREVRPLQGRLSVRLLSERSLDRDRFDRRLARAQEASRRSTPRFRPVPPPTPESRSRASSRIFDAQVASGDGPRLQLPRAAQRPHQRGLAGGPHAALDGGRERLRPRAVRRPDLALVDLALLGDLRARGRLTGRRRPRRRPPHAGWRLQSVREAGRGHPHALRHAVDDPVDRAGPRDEAARAARPCRDADVRRLPVDPVELGALQRRRADLSAARAQREHGGEPSARPAAGTSSTPTEVTQDVFDRVMWYSVHGRRSQPPPPGPRATAGQ